MSLHRTVPDSLLPAVLLTPLEFGNRDQINALVELENTINDSMLEEERLESGEMSKYNVELSFSGSQFFEVVAFNKDNAIELALDELVIDDSSIDIDSQSAVKVSDQTKK